MQREEQPAQKRLHRASSATQCAAAGLPLAVGTWVRCEGVRWIIGQKVSSGAGATPFQFVARHVLPKSHSNELSLAMEKSPDVLRSALMGLGLGALAATVADVAVPGVETEPLELEVWTCGAKGCGVRPTRAINEGEPIADYCGEVLSTAEAHRRQLLYDTNVAQGRMNYLLVLLEHLPDRVVRTSIDPTRVGGVARCFNHSCDPNLKPVVLRLGTVVPTVRFYAARPIAAGEELCFDYGELGFVDSEFTHEADVTRTKCLCGTSKCRGLLPFNTKQV